VHAAHCLASERCGSAGNCGFDGKDCVPTEAAHCERSERCRTEGACGLEPSGDCVATKSEHCTSSKGCRERGACVLGDFDLEKACGAGTHADCAKTALCKEQGRCWVLPTRGDTGTCIRAELRDRESFRLTEPRHGMAGELVVRVDSRTPKTKDPRGYFPSEDDPRANAVLEVRAASGEVKHALEVYPAVDVVKRELGSGTDAFFVTEQWACAAGHWCGWTTTVFEVRAGRIARVEALGADGKVSELTMTASQGSRWKVGPGAAPLTREVLVQSEGPAPAVPALTETRYFFASGRWRFTERTFERYDPSVSKQPGAWNGALEFHEQ
jgi:hypothetical protein